MTQENLLVMSQIARQQSDDIMKATIMAAFFEAALTPKGEAAEVNDANGIVGLILSYEIGKFLTSCLKGQKECSFDSLYNWAIQYGRGIVIIHPTTWRKNTSKACRKLWKTIPSKMKGGKKTSNFEYVYSTADPDIKAVAEHLKEKAEFFKSIGLKKQAAAAEKDLFIITSK